MEKAIKHFFKQTLDLMSEAEPKLKDALHVFAKIFGKW